VHAAVIGSVALGSAALAQELAGRSTTTATVSTGIAPAGKLAALSQTLAAVGAKTWLVGAAVALGVGSGAGLWAVTAGKTASPDDVPVLTAPPAKLSVPTAPSALAPSQPHPEPPPSSGEGKSAPAPAATSTRRLDLRDELAGVREAERALNAGNPTQALAMLDELGRFAGGHMREERAALRALAHCQLGTATSLDRARRFLNDYPSSVYAFRVRTACEK
jgi:hypothetical protein